MGKDLKMWVLSELGFLGLGGFLGFCCWLFGGLVFVWVCFYVHS